MATSAVAELIFSGKGLSSKKEVSVKITRKNEGHGIVFQIPDKKNEGQYLEVRALAENVVNTLRNVTIGEGSSRLCLVEHILCAVGLWGLEDLLIEVDGLEIPLVDGSAMFWLDLLESSGWPKQNIEAELELSEPIIVKKGDRLLMAIPDQTFSLNYMLDLNHPKIGKVWQSFAAGDDPRSIGDARTFGSLQEHKLLGIEDQVSMTADGFDRDLRFTDEPVRHKLLDLFGDLMLAGVNPQKWKARFISIKGGHEMDVEMAKRLRALL